MNEYERTMQINDTLSEIYSLEACRNLFIDDDYGFAYEADDANTNGGFKAALKKAGTKIKEVVKEIIRKLRNFVGGIIYNIGNVLAKFGNFITQDRPYNAAAFKTAFKLFGMSLKAIKDAEDPSEQYNGVEESIFLENGLTALEANGRKIARSNKNLERNQYANSYDPKKVPGLADAMYNGRKQIEDDRLLNEIDAARTRANKERLIDERHTRQAQSEVDVDEERQARIDEYKLEEGLRSFVTVLSNCNVKENDIKAIVNMAHAYETQLKSGKMTTGGDCSGPVKAAANQAKKETATLAKQAEGEVVKAGKQAEADPGKAPKVAKTGNAFMNRLRAIWSAIKDFFGRVKLSIGKVFKKSDKKEEAADAKVAALLGRYDDDLDYNAYESYDVYDDYSMYDFI